MYCPQCGTKTSEDAAFCTSCGTDLRAYREKWGQAPFSQSADGQQASADEHRPDSPAGASATPDPGAPDSAPLQGGPPPYQPYYQPQYPPPYPGAGQPPYQPHYQPGYQAPAQQTPGYPDNYYQPRTYPPYQPGYDPARGAYVPPKIPNYLAWAIVTLILCFLPTGILALVYATRVDNRLSAGDIAGAKDASGKAKIWCWVSFGIGVAKVIAMIIFFILIFAATVRTGGGNYF